MSSVWCLDCKNYGGGNVCYAGRDPRENSGLCLWEEKNDERLSIGSSIWCMDCKNYGGGNVCTAGQNPENNNGLCLWEEK